MTSLFMFLCFFMTGPDAPSGFPMEKFLPSSIHRWTVSDSALCYHGKAIFNYMDGAGEVYLAYDFRDLLVQRYACPGQEEILVEIFDMGLPRNAFGIFSYMEGRGPAVAVGQAGEYKSGLLCFWKDHYFVCVQVDRENEEAKSAQLEMGKQISDAIRRDGDLPRILRYLPEGEYTPGTLRYFFRNEILNIHFYVADDNVLLLDGRTEAVLVRMKSDKSYLLLIEYPEPALADSAYHNFLSHYMPDASGAGIVRSENNKWTACVKHATYVAVVFDAPSSGEARNHLSGIERRLP
jgi:Family of unknown function (DUF6599)